MAASSILIGRALVALLADAFADMAVPVAREAYDALTPDDLPCIRVFEDQDDLETEFVGGTELRTATLAVECYADGADAALSMEAVAALREQCRAAIQADRTLAGACDSLDIRAGTGGRLEMPERSMVRVQSLQVLAYYVLAT